MPSAHGLTIYLVAVLFVATLVRSALGFGEALIAVPLLAFVIPVDVAAPVAVLVSITVALVVIARDWREIHWSSAAWLVASTACGIPFGLFLLTRVPPSIVKGVLALLVGGFAVWSLGRTAARGLRTDRTAWLFGITAGVLGGAYGMNGPPLIVYGSLRRWSPVRFRATLQGYFLPASLMGMAGYWAAGLWTTRVSHDFLVALPVFLAAILVGDRLHRRIDTARFHTLVHVSLAGVGIVLLLQAIGALPG
jgi:uncharacterized membrane protein YfcA